MKTQICLYLETELIVLLRAKGLNMSKVVNNLLKDYLEINTDEMKDKSIKDELEIRLNESLTQVTNLKTRIREIDRYKKEEEKKAFEKKYGKTVKILEGDKDAW